MLNEGRAPSRHLHLLRPRPEFACTATVADTRTSATAADAGSSLARSTRVNG